jgi:hypothetical protein
MKRLLSLVLVLVLLWPRVAAADPTPTKAGDPTWGWLLVGGSILAGAAIVTVGVTAIDCKTDDLKCSRWSSLVVISGLGVASVGSTAGIILVERANRRVALAGPVLIGTF